MENFIDVQFTCVAESFLILVILTGIFKLLLIYPAV